MVKHDILNYDILHTTNGKRFIICLEMLFSTMELQHFYAVAQQNVPKIKNASWKKLGKKHIVNIYYVDFPKSVLQQQKLTQIVISLKMNIYTIL